MNNDKREIPFTHPGVILEEEILKKRGISQKKLASETNIPLELVKEICQGKKDIDKDTAQKLASYFHVSIDFWINIQNHYNSVGTEEKTQQELPTVSAWTVAKYLLFLDPKNAQGTRGYFSREHSLIVNNEEGYKSKPTIGNFRLNKMLQITQSLYFGRYKQTLFTDKMAAFEHGGVVHSIFSSFTTLHDEDDYIPPLLVEKQRNFIEKVFFYLRDNYSDSELRDLAHKDLAWQKAREKRSHFDYNDEVLEYYETLSSSMLRAMGLIEETDC